VIRKNRLPHPTLRLIFTVSEEVGLLGAKALPKKVLAGDFCITLDHGKVNEIIYKAPAQQNIKATVIGRAAHAGIHPEHGINAIKVAAEAIAKMKFGRIDKETTSNIGVIRGGKAPTVESVARQCKKILGRQHLSAVIKTDVKTGAGKTPRLAYSVDPAALYRLCQTRLGKNVLITDHDDWEFIFICKIKDIRDSTSTYPIMVFIFSICMNRIPAYGTSMSFKVYKTSTFGKFFNNSFWIGNGSLS